LEKRRLTFDVGGEVGMRGRKSADMALSNGSANRQQRWGNGKGTNCTT
jgi:hypothetical protein